MKVRSYFEKIADPFIVLGIFALFLIPAVTVFNLTPIKFNKPNNDSILGVEESKLITITENTTKSDGISIDDFIRKDDTSYRMKISHLSHTIGNYENLIFTAENPTKEEKVIKVTSSHEITDQGVEVSLVARGSDYILLKDDGSVYPVSIYIEPDEKIDINLSIKSPIDVNFTSYHDLNIFVD